MPRKVSNYLEMHYLHFELHLKSTKIALIVQVLSKTREFQKTKNLPVKIFRVFSLIDIDLLKFIESLIQSQVRNETSRMIQK